MLGHVLDQVDVLVIGGGMANTFLRQGHQVGKSLCERDLADTAREIMAKAEAKTVRDRPAGRRRGRHEFEAGRATRTVPVEQVARRRDDPRRRARDGRGRRPRLARCKTLLWNGPLGAFEIAPFDQGTNAAARQAAG